ncbi:DUF1214 domain-containing protein [Bradyrhizobium sp. 604_D8_N2_3]|uniref:DUF1214 domain-containing protein n=1 Tax=Bradyrhizobium sp. 604_D8_N2_3 TaxID=3240370 RepID=UPI003F1E4DF7
MVLVAPHARFARQGVAENADGSVDIYIGPEPPAGQQSNWLYTPAGQKWLP